MVSYFSLLSPFVRLASAPRQSPRSAFITYSMGSWVISRDKGRSAAERHGLKIVAIE
jgi:hypothetical protein